MIRPPTVAVVGCPNAGKSTLINRLTGTRTTVVHETPGVTRDWKAIEAEWCGHTFMLIDTGGFDIGDRSTLGGDIRVQVREALNEADAVLFVVDGRAGPMPGDHEIAEVLRRTDLPVVLVANKLDDPARYGDAVAFYELGLGEAFAVSAIHGTSTGDLLDELVAVLPEGEPGADVTDSPPEIPVAIVGRPNAGKSSLMNALTGRQRVIVSDVPGTTRDSIDTTLQWGDDTLRLVDTAGMRKAAKVSGVEYYSYLRSLQTLDRAHVAIVLVDATLGVGELDLSISSEAMHRGCATILAVNKIDVADPDIEEMHWVARKKLRQQPPVVPISAREGVGLDELVDLVVALESRYTAHIPTPVLNRTLQTILSQRPMPGRGRKRLKAYFVSQYRTSPPRFSIGVNDRTLVTRDFGYFVENRLRDAFALHGVPVVIDFKDDR